MSLSNYFLLVITLIVHLNYYKLHAQIISFDKTILKIVNNTDSATTNIVTILNNDHNKEGSKGNTTVQDSSTEIKPVNVTVLYKIPQLISPKEIIITKNDEDIFAIIKSTTYTLEKKVNLVGDVNITRVMASVDICTNNSTKIKFKYNFAKNRLFKNEQDFFKYIFIEKLNEVISHSSIKKNYLMLHDVQFNGKTRKIDFTIIFTFNQIMTQNILFDELIDKMFKDKHCTDFDKNSLQSIVEHVAFSQLLLESNYDKIPLYYNYIMKNCIKYKRNNDIKVHRIESQLLGQPEIKKFNNEPEIENQLAHRKCDRIDKIMINVQSVEIEKNNNRTFEFDAKSINHPLDVGNIMMQLFTAKSLNIPLF
ncbi:hypothetical protein A3Q56_01219 [Intoshia linei]|uniref:Uncharacterized protein n=1 Tax=Intoshia linei TaxID=1819745 RepID=A0A177BC68_9BILA|nr:hypothetical protein A3Q56_01219 [Intoshia linei]